ncbi:hypothetical protein J6590_062835 [Homalodisca vitripennis]|nr:hypothetical protein J6590_062835 [Homalodisca vitripennis]
MLWRTIILFVGLLKNTELPSQCWLECFCLHSRHQALFVFPCVQFKDHMLKGAPPDQDCQIPLELQQPKTSSDLQSSTHTTTPLNFYPPLSSQPPVNNPLTSKFTESLLDPPTPQSSNQMNPVSTIITPEMLRPFPKAGRILLPPNPDGHLRCSLIGPAVSNWRTIAFSDLM